LSRRCLDRFFFVSAEGEATEEGRGNGSEEISKVRGCALVSILAQGLTFPVLITLVCTGGGTSGTLGPVEVRFETLVGPVERFETFVVDPVGSFETLDPVGRFETLDFCCCCLFFFFFLSSFKRFCSSSCCLNGENADFTGAEVVSGEEVEKEDTAEDENDKIGEDTIEGEVKEEDKEEEGETSKSRKACEDFNFGCCG